MMQPRIVVMLPTYNEAGTIQQLLEQLLALDEGLACVVVDDMSPDGTGAIVRQVAEVNPGRIKLIERAGRRGRASAGVEGFREALALEPEFVVEMDADLSHDPAYIKTFLEEIEDCDVVVGSRMVPGGQDAERGLFRTQVSVISGWVFRLVLGLKVRDIGAGYKLYRYEVLASLPWSEMLSDGIAISMEELFRIAKKGYRIKEVPIVFKERRAGQSKLRWRDFAEPLLVSLRLVWSLGRASASEGGPR